MNLKIQTTQAEGSTALFDGTSRQCSLKSFQKLFLLSIFIFITHFSYSQKLIFCERVDSITGVPGKASNEFTIGSNGGFFILLVTMPKGINSTFVTYDIFHLNEDNKEAFENTIKQNVQPEYTWFSKQVTFRKAGQYNVYVYNDKDQLLCAGSVMIKME